VWYTARTATLGISEKLPRTADSAYILWAVSFLVNTNDIDCCPST
jgi:hypothetical protein